MNPAGRPFYLDDGTLVCPECVECSHEYGFDVVFGMSCWLHGHTRLTIPPPGNRGEEE